MTANKLGYSVCWEDPAIDLEGLAIRPGDQVVTISSAGCNALSLLLSEAARVTAVDYNPWQNALLELKSAAVAALGREEYLAFAGETHAVDRLRTFEEQLASRLPEATRRFWNGRWDWLTSGVDHAGALERHFGHWRRLMRLVQGERRLRAMFECRSLDEQRSFFSSEWDRAPYRWVVRLFFNRWSLSLAKHPDHFRYVSEPDIAGNFLDKCKHAMTDLEIRSNYFLAQIFLGRYLDSEAVPPFLAAGSYERVRERLPRLAVETGSLVDVLARLEPGSIRAFYLSNILEWLSPEAVEAVFAAMTRTAAPGARASCRTLLAVRELPAAYRETWRPLEPLSRELLFRDRSFLYSTYQVLERV